MAFFADLCREKLLGFLQSVYFKYVFAQTLLCFSLSPTTATADFSKYRSVLDAKGCEIVLNQKTKSCRTILHGVCDGGKRAALYFDRFGELEFKRIMVQGVNQTTFQTVPFGPIFVREALGDNPVDRELLMRGGSDTFSFVSTDTSGFGFSIVMSGTVKLLPKTSIVSGRQLSFLYWDWTYTVESPQGQLVSRIKTTTEFDFSQDLWLGNYVEATDQFGKLEITNDHSVKLIAQGEPGFGSVSSICDPENIS